MINLIYLYYYIIFEPEEIINQLQTINKKILIIHKIIISIILASSILIQKNRIIINDFILLFFLIVLFYLFISMSSRILSTLYYIDIAKSQRYNEERLSRITQIIKDIQSIFELTWFPMIFFIHISILSKYFDSYLLFFIGFLILIIWMFYIWIKSLQYYLEWEFKSLVQVIINHFIILLSFFILNIIIFFLSLFIIIN